MRAVRHFLWSLRFGKGSAAVKLCTGNVETAVPAGLRLILNLNQLIDVALLHEPLAERRVPRTKPEKCL